MLGFKSDMLMLPEHGVGAVILTNGDTGSMMLGAFRRRLLEVLFDGKPEAVDNLLTSVKQFKANVAKNRERLTIPADPAAVAKLAARYHNAALGRITVKTANGATVFDFDEWNGRSRRARTTTGRSPSSPSILQAASSSSSPAIRSCCATASTSTCSRRSPRRRRRARARRGRYAPATVQGSRREHTNLNHTYRQRAA